MRSYEVVAAMIIRDGKLLAMQRGYGELEGGWEFPGGKIEPGEMPEDALVREIHEELDATIRVDSPFAHIDYTYDSFHLDMRCFLCTLVSDSFTLLEHSDARWLDGAHLHSVAWLPADIQVIDEVERRGILG